MPRKSPFHIDLSAEEENELLRRSLKYTLSYFEVQRAKMILMAAAGIDNDEIATRLDTRREVVNLWRKRSSRSDWRAWRKEPALVAPGLSPPELIVEIKALACELPVTLGLPVSRLSVADVARHAECSGLVARISNSTVWRWLHEDAIRPWQHRCWIFPRDPQFQSKAGRILDLYARCWQAQTLRDDEFVISTDEKTSIQARVRIHTSLAARPGQTMRVEHEHARAGAWAYLAALDVHRAKMLGRCESSTGIAPFDRRVEQVMRQPPYKEARRVFWIMDNGSSHRGEASVRRLTQAHPRWVPVHASWLNQIETYCSIVQRKALTPNDFLCLQSVAERLERFERYYESIAHPSEWKFTRADLNALMARMRSRFINFL